jgi:hypothetical protein
VRGGEVTALRVYLFADFGKGPRVVAKCSGYIPNGGRPYIRLDEHNLRAWRDSHLAPDAEFQVRTGKVRAWWLVECDSAEAGRALIEGPRRYHPEGGMSAPMPGGFASSRILAGGGRS